MDASHIFWRSIVAGSCLLGGMVLLADCAGSPWIRVNRCLFQFLKCLGDSLHSADISFNEAVGLGIV